jgi:hypothetical protein
MVITGPEGLAAAFPEKEIRDRLEKEVDFAKDKLLFFAWADCHDDKLDFKVEEDKRGPIVTFQYRAGTEDLLASHFHLFAVPKRATWRVEGK